MKIKKLCLVTIAALWCSMTVSAEVFSVGGISYNITSSTDLMVEVTRKYSNEYSGVVTIPPKVTYNGKTYSVTSIGDGAFQYCGNLTSITLPASVTSIGAYAFQSCSNLTDITLPASVTSIGECAFEDCGSFTSITIPESVTSIGQSAFYGCNSVERVTINCAIVGDWFSGMQSIKEFVLGEGVTSIGRYAFYGQSSLTSITLPEGMTSIGDQAFAYCNLTSITLPKSVTSIGSSTFYVCASLTTITFPENSQLKSIGSFAFYGCNSLTSIILPEGVTGIGYEAFEGCSSLASITLPESVTSIGHGAFLGCSSLTAVHISSLEAWCNIDFGNDDANPLSSAKNLYLNGELVTELTIPNSVATIKDYTFYNCSSLTAINIPENSQLTSIGQHAFDGCGSLTTITLPENSQLKSIGSFAFYGCSSLTAITIPENSQLTSIGYVAFFRCSSLSSITLPENSQLTSIGDYAFSDCGSLTAFTIPEGVTSIGEAAFFGCYFSYDNFINNSACVNDYYWDATLFDKEYDGICIQNDTKVVACRPNVISGVIPEGVTCIGYWAFRLCSSLTTITLPESMNRIEGKTFASCPQLTDVYCYAEIVPDTETDAFDVSSIEHATLYVPESAINSYKTTAPWCEFGTIKVIDNVILKKCATPTISYVDGKVSLTCATEGAKVSTDVVAEDAHRYEDFEFTLSATYTITAYATKENYANSDPVTLTICWVPCTEEHEEDDETTGILTIPSKPVLISTWGGVITLSGLAEGTEVAIYSTSGTLLATVTATDSIATLATDLSAGTTAIVKIGECSIKMVIK